MSQYFIESNLISENQSRFKRSDSRVNKLLVATHEIFSSFDDNYKVKRVYLNSFFDDTLLFSTVKLAERTANKLNMVLKEINKWAFQRKISFNLDSTKLAQ